MHLYQISHFRWREEVTEGAAKSSRSRPPKYTYFLAFPVPTKEFPRERSKQMKRLISKHERSVPATSGVVVCKLTVKRTGPTTTP